MGLLDNLKKFFSVGSEREINFENVNDDFEKEKLSSRIVNLVDKIQRINSFDSSVWNMSNVSTFELKRKSVDELRKICVSLENRLVVLEGQKKSNNNSRDALEEAKWTGKQIQGMSKSDLDRAQREDD